MRLASAPLLLASLLTAAAAAQTPSAQPTTHQPATSAAIPPYDFYRNDTLHLSYGFPFSFTDASDTVTAAFRASLAGDPASAAQAACLSLPFSRMQSANNQMSLVLLIRADAACLKKKFTAKSVIQAAQDETRSLVAAGAKTSFGQPVTFQVSNHPAALLVGSFTLPTGQNMQAMVVCLLARPDIACWQFLATDPQRLRTMAAFPIAFGDDLSTPLVPPELLTK